MLVDAEGRLSGVFTDSDLARLVERRCDHLLDGPVRDVMTKRPCTVPNGAMMTDAIAIMGERKISELPVVDAEGFPVGLIDITDVVGMLPREMLSQFSEISHFARPASPPLRFVVVHETPDAPTA